MDTSVYIQCQEGSNRWRHFIPRDKAEAYAAGIRAKLPGVSVTIEWEQVSAAMAKKWAEVYSGH